jgi:hypothetical protein
MDSCHSWRESHIITMCTVVDVFSVKHELVRKKQLSMYSRTQRYLMATLRYRLASRLFSSNNKYATDGIAHRKPAGN